MFSTPTGKRAIYYHTSWACYGRNYQVKDIPEDVVDIAYAFYNIDSTGRVFSGDPWADTDKRYIGNEGVPPEDTWDGSVPPRPFYGNFSQFQKLKNAGRRLNIQLSI